MLALADQFPEWKDFPKGLHVMLVDQDPDVIEDVRCKLGSCGYLVTCYMKGEEALKELEDRSKSFHVVVVDATRSDIFDGFKIVAAANHLTTIMMASTENMNIMMQGIAAGASEFLQKPLSEERLKNIWQHVVRKALVTGHLAVPTTVAPTGNDLKSKASSPQLSVCNEVKEDGELANYVKQEEEACCKYNLCKDVADEMPSVHEFFFQEEDHHQHHDSSYFDMDEKDNCDAFLCSTPPQLEQSCTRIVCMDHEDNPELVGSPALSVSQELNVACMKRELNDIHECFNDCDNYLHIKSEVEEAVNNSAILNELFDSKVKMDSDNYLLMSNDPNIGNAEFGDPKLCADLQFDDIPDSLDDIGLDSDILDDATDQSLSMGLDCLDDEDFQEADEEALLLAEVAKAEEGLLINPRCNAAPLHHNSSNNGNSLCHSNSIATADPSNGGKFEAHEETRSKSDSEQSCNTKGTKSSSGKKKMKVDWTPELHRRFVQAVEQLGVDKAIPSRILELMGVKCLTRHNIASHLQKYRSHRKHVLAREAEAASWNQRRQMEAAAAASRAVAPQPPAHHHHHHHHQQHATWQAARQTQPRTALPAPALHVWGHPTLEPSMHFWPAWPPPGCQLDAWGNPFYAAQPILRVPLAPMPSIANMAFPPACGKLANLHPPKETVIAAINEVLRNPYIPLPLGLKPPSLESVVSELQRQGISMAPTATV